MPYLYRILFSRSEVALIICISNKCLGNTNTADLGTIFEKHWLAVLMIEGRDGTFRFRSWLCCTLIEWSRASYLIVDTLLCYYINTQQEVITQKLAVMCNLASSPYNSNNSRSILFRYLQICNKNALCVLPISSQRIFKRHVFKGPDIIKLSKSHCFIGVILK